MVQITSKVLWVTKQMHDGWFKSYHTEATDSVQWKNPDATYVKQWIWKDHWQKLLYRVLRSYQTPRHPIETVRVKQV